MRDIEKNIMLYFFDPNNGVYIGKGSSGDSENYQKPENAVLKEVPAIPEGHYAEWENEDWLIKKKTVYEVDESGFLLHEIEMPIPYNSRSNRLFIDNQPPEAYKKPRWSGRQWEDKPRPADLYIPVFDVKKDMWIETAKSEEIAGFIDSETETLIANWCRSQKKCEAYYINKGIENAKDPEYEEYQKARVKIISGQRKKKIKLGVYEK